MCQAYNPAEVDQNAYNTITTRLQNDLRTRRHYSHTVLSCTVCMHETAANRVRGLQGSQCSISDGGSHSASIAWHIISSIWCRTRIVFTMTWHLQYTSCSGTHHKYMTPKEAMEESGDLVLCCMQNKLVLRTCFTQASSMQRHRRYTFHFSSYAWWSKKHTAHGFAAVWQLCWNMSRCKWGLRPVTETHAWNAKKWRIVKHLANDVEPKTSQHCEFNSTVRKCADGGLLAWQIMTTETVSSHSCMERCPHIATDSQCIA